MTKLIWMSDPHFQAKGTIDGLDPRLRLDAAITHMNTHHADADALIVSGDLVGDDVEADYASIAQYLGQSIPPVYPMMGNNDSWATFRQYLTVPPTAMSEFIQYTVQTQAGLLVMLDTHMQGSHAGQLCEDRLGWLDGILGSNTHQPVFIFMHHPALPLRLPPQDTIMLEDADRFLGLIARHPNVAHLFMGHVHRATSGNVAGVPFATIGSLAFQAPAPRPTWDWNSFKPPAEAPQYAVVLIEGGNTVVQYTQFCDYALGIEQKATI